jgi:hypothetical protein
VHNGRDERIVQHGPRFERGSPMSTRRCGPSIRPGAADG